MSLQEVLPEQLAELSHHYHQRSHPTLLAVHKQIRSHGSRCPLQKRIA